MKAGFSQIDYTPLRGFMPGEFDAYYAIGTYIPLLVNAAAFTSEGETVILISADHLLFTNDYSDMIREKIAEATRVPVKNVLLAATHTHTGPSYNYSCWKSPAEPEVAQVVANRIIKAAVEAFENQKEGFSFATATTEEKRFSFCRDWVLTDGRIKTNPGYARTDLDHPCDTPDYTVEIMKLERNGRIEAIMVNYANHPDTNGGAPRNKFSSDWPGAMRETLKEKYGDDVVVLFFNGCCGDVNHHDFKYKTDLETYIKEGVYTPGAIGHGLAETVIAALDGKEATVGDFPVSAIEYPITVKRRQITEDERQWAIDILKEAETEYIASWKYGTASAYLSTCDNVPETQEFTVYAYKVGPWAMIAMPGEMYTAVGRRIKEGSPFEKTIPVELANGHNGYVIPDSVRNNGSYEGRFSSGTTGYGAMDAIVNGSIEALKAIAK